MSEWWLIDGEARFADGDTGDINHEGMAVEAMQSMAADRVAAIDAPWASRLAAAIRRTAERYGGDVIAMRTEINDVTDEICDGDSDHVLWDDWPGTLKGLVAEQDRELLEAAWSDTADGRLLAMSRLGWVRMAGHALELWSLADVLPTLADGVWAALDPVDEGDLANEVFSIEERSTGRCWWTVPWPAIEAGELEWFWRNMERIKA